jgi:CheY-like chemotaxis protein
MTLPTTGLEGLVVLVVEDAVDIGRMVQRALERAGARVVVAGTAADALAAAERARPDVIVSDIGLPDDSGLNLLRRLRERPETRAVPMIALTGETRDEAVREMLTVGFARCLAKPIALGALARAVIELAATRPR